MEPKERDSGEGRRAELQAVLHFIEPRETRWSLTNSQSDRTPVLGIGRWHPIGCAARSLVALCSMARCEPTHL